MLLKNEIFTNQFMTYFKKLRGLELNPARIFALSKLNEELMKNSKIFEEARLKLLEQHASKLNEETGRYEFETPKQEEAFGKDWEELLEIEQEYNYQKITLPEEVNGKTFVIDTDTVYALRDILTQ